MTSTLLLLKLLPPQPAVIFNRKRPINKFRTTSKKKSRLICNRIVSDVDAVHCTATLYYLSCVRETQRD